MADEEYHWFDADSVDHPFDDLGLTVLKGAHGRFMPEFAFIEDEVPLQPGTRLRSVTTKARRWEFPAKLEGISSIDYRTKLRDLFNVFDPNRGDGRIRVISYDGGQRDLFCRYTGGLELDESIKGTTWIKTVLVFHASDPYWYDTATNVRTYELGDAAPFFPIFPLVLVSSTIFADATENNLGDVEAWPVWIITGPGSNIILRNQNTGKILTLNTTLGTGETVTIDTRPAGEGSNTSRKTVIKNDGTNLYGSLAAASSLWPLAKGSNSLRMEMSGANSNSSIQMSYRTRYLGA